MVLLRWMCNLYFLTLFVRDFAAMGSFSFNPHAQFLVRSAEWIGVLHRLEITRDKEYTGYDAF